VADRYGGDGVLVICLRYALAGWGAPDAEISRLAKQLDPTEIAYLARGRRHAIEAAVAGLLHGEAVERNGVGFVITQRGRTLLVSPDAQDRARALAPLEALALSRATDSASSLEGVASSAEEVESAMRRRLRELGVLWGSSRATWLWTLMPALVWIALGIAKLGVGVARHRPVGWLVVLLAAGGALILVRPPRASRRVRACCATSSARRTAWCRPRAQRRLSCRTPSTRWPTRSPAARSRWQR
jgi:uncharacterized protein (TIGR04222 family)